MQLDINIERMRSFIDRHLGDTGCGADGAPPFSSLEFNILGTCNRACVFCPKGNPEEFPNVAEYLSLDLYRKIVDELRDLRYTGRIAYSGFSEPLIHPKVVDLVAYSKTTCPAVTVEITTNGDPLTPKKLKALFTAGLDHLKISVYDGPEAQARFERLRDEMGLTDKQIIIRGRWLPPEQKFGLTMSNRAGSISLPEIGVGPLKEPLRQSCYYPFYKMMVDYTGEVLICSNDWAKKLVVGDLNQSTLMEVWNGPLFNELRKRLINKDRSQPPCNLCDVHGLYNGEDHFAAWERYLATRAPQDFSAR